jgi:hypothetical protein
VSLGAKLWTAYAVQGKPMMKLTNAENDQLIALYQDLRTISHGWSQAVWRFTNYSVLLIGGIVLAYEKISTKTPHIQAVFCVALLVLVILHIALMLFLQFKKANTRFNVERVRSLFSSKITENAYNLKNPKQEKAPLYVKFNPFHDRPDDGNFTTIWYDFRSTVAIAMGVVICSAIIAGILITQ